MSDKLTFDDLKSHLFVAADILRKSLNASDNYKAVLPLLFLKRLNDIFEENAGHLIRTKKLSKDEAYGNPRRHAFFIPEKARYSVLEKASEDVGAKIISVCSTIERENPLLDGTLVYSEFNKKKSYSDQSLRKLIALIGSKPLGNNDLENEDVFGDAYEYLLEAFADETKKKGGQFYTPRQVVRLLVSITEPQEGHRICDPTCGSGGMLIHSSKFVVKHSGNPRKITLEGQESNPDTVNMCKMNMVLHGLSDFNIEWEDVLGSPKLVEGGKLKEYDRVLANFPFSEDWDNKNAANDPYKRFEYGIPPAKDKADFAFIQHMLASLNEAGQAAIVCSQGVLFRGNEEQKIRKNMVLGDEKKGLQGDVIEAVIALPAKIFYGTGIPGCVLVLNRNKPKKRRDKIMFIYAAKDYESGKVRNKLREEDIRKIVSAFKKFEDIDRYCHVASVEELEENEFNLNVPRYVDISEPEEEIDIQTTIDELKNIEKERQDIEKLVRKDLQELGTKI